MDENTEQRNEYTYETAVSELQTSGKGGALKKYMALAVGSDSLMELIKYDLITGAFSGFPGALGYLLRQKLYRCILGKMGRGVAIGKNVTIRGARKIRLGSNVLIEDNCSIDARAGDSRIVIGDNVMVARNTIMRARSGEITINDGTSVGSDCIIATDSKIAVGKDVLIAAYCYVSSGGSHNYDDTTLPIIKQGVTRKGGIVIGDGAWLGARVTVLDGVTVGEGAIIGAHSLVNKEVPPMSISFGTPAKVLRMRGGK